MLSGFLLFVFSTLSQDILCARPQHCVEKEARCHWCSENADASVERALPRKWDGLTLPGVCEVSF